MVKLPINAKSDREFKKAINWFENAFNCTPYLVTSESTCFTLGGIDIALYKEKLDKKTRGQKNIVYLVVKDISNIYSRLISLGANNIQKPFELTDEIIIARVKNPFGHILCLIDDPSYKTLIN